MFVAEKIRGCSEGLIGIRQPFDPSYAIFEADLLTSKSGYFIDDIPLFRAEYFIDVVCPKNSTTSEKNDLFRQMLGDSTINVVNQVFVGTSIIDRQVQYVNANNLTEIETGLPNGFIGQRFRQANLKDVAFKLNRLFLTVDGSGDLEIRLYNSFQSTPVKTKIVTINSSQKSYIVELDWACDNTDFYKGEWFVGYTLDGNIQPYKRVFENSNIQSQVKELYYEEINVPGHMTTDLFDLKKYGENGNLSTGMNFDITTYEDKTSFVCSNTTHFARAVQLELAIQIIQRVISSNRSNVNERYSNDLKRTLLASLKGLKGQGIAEKGLENQLISEVSRIREEVEKLKRGSGQASAIYVRTMR